MTKFNDTGQDKETQGVNIDKSTESDDQSAAGDIADGAPRVVDKGDGQIPAAGAD